ncbi:Lipid phosphate phosphatase epsilon 2, chloroplastic [Linum grandiflorum]
MTTLTLQHRLLYRSLSTTTFNYSLSRPGLQLQCLAQKPIHLGWKSRAVPSSSNGTKPTNLVDSDEDTKRSSSRDKDHDGQGAKGRSMGKWVAAGAFGGLILWKRDGEATWLAGGAVLNFFLSVMLKCIVKQERPALASRSDHGMPSSHAQTLFYVVTCAILATVKWVGGNEVVSVMLSTLFLASGSYLSWQRVLQKFHTVEQVVVGAGVGSSFEALWYYWLWNGIVGEAFVSSVWVRMVVHLGGLVYCGCFLVYFVNHLRNKEES